MGKLWGTVKKGLRHTAFVAQWVVFVFAVWYLIPEQTPSWILAAGFLAILVASIKWTTGTIAHIRLMYDQDGGLGLDWAAVVIAFGVQLLGVVSFGWLMLGAPIGALITTTVWVFGISTIITGFWRLAE